MRAYSSNERPQGTTSSYLKAIDIFQLSIKEKDLSRKGAKAEAHMREMSIRRQDIGNPEFQHNRHRRKIGKRYSWLVRELFPQFDRLGEAGLGDFLNINKGRLHNICCEMPGI